MPGPWALAWLREQVGQGLAWGGATLHKGLRWLAGCQEVGGWLGTTPGWDTAPILGVPSHSQHTGEEGLQARAGHGSFPEAMD